MKNQKLYCRLGWAVTCLVVLPFLMSAFFKLVPTAYPEMPAQMEKMGLALSLLPLLASLELMCVIVYLIPKTSVLGAVLFTGYLGGAMLTHLRVGEPIFIHLILGGFIWLGIYLREPRLRALLPIRCSS